MRYREKQKSIYRSMLVKKWSYSTDIEKDKNKYTLAYWCKKLVSAIPAGLKCEIQKSCYRLQYRYIYFIISKQIVTKLIFFLYSLASILPGNPIIIKIIQ
jgi:hypothetical protein